MPVQGVMIAAERRSQLAGAFLLLIVGACALWWLGWRAFSRDGAVPAYPSVASGEATPVFVLPAVPDAI